METGQRFETQRLDHLGIVAGISQEIGLIEAIDQQVGLVQRKISCGQAVQAMVLNALGFSSRALYLMPDYLRNKPIDLRTCARRGLCLAAERLEARKIPRTCTQQTQCRCMAAQQSSRYRTMIIRVEPPLHHP